jgi:nucleoside-diphosphate kinase
MYDVKLKRIFLKKVEIPSVCLDDFFCGAQVTVLSRVLRVTDYGDVHTRKRFEVDKSRTFAMIKPDAYKDIGKIIDAISQSGFAINKLKMSRFSKASSSQFYKEHEGKPFFPNLQAHMTSDVVVGMELVAADAVPKWRALLGPTNTQVAKQQAPQSLRALYGTDGTKNACHGSDSAGSFKREADLFFGGEPGSRVMRTTALLNNCTLCLIKPHIVKEGRLG